MHLGVMLMRLSDEVTCGWAQCCTSAINEDGEVGKPTFYAGGQQPRPVLPADHGYYTAGGVSLPSSPRGSPRRLVSPRTPSRQAITDGMLIPAVDLHASMLMQGLYTVMIRREEGDRLGLDIDFQQDSMVLPIVAVTGGVAERWNHMNPDRRFNDGDKIVEVNGVSRDAVRMVQICQDATFLCLRVVRGDSPASGLLEAGLLPQLPPPTSGGRLAAPSSRPLPGLNGDCLMCALTGKQVLASVSSAWPWTKSIMC